MWGSIGQLAAEYNTIAASAQRDRWVTLLHHSGLSPDQVEKVVDAESFGPLTVALRRAEAHYHTLEILLPRLVAVRQLVDAEDLGAVLRHRLQVATSSRAGSRGGPAPRLIVGLIPEARGPMTAEMRATLTERATLIMRRAAAIVESALGSGEPWIAALGTPPSNTRRRSAWVSQVQMIAAYRDRYQITDSIPLGDGGVDRHQPSDDQRSDAQHARAALRNAYRLSDAETTHGEQRRTGEIHRTRPPML